jgi:hypothetical protein
MAMDFVDLTQLTDSQLESAIELGEGLTEPVSILEHNRPRCEVLESVYVIDWLGNTTKIATKVKYDLTLEDDHQEEGELDCIVSVSVSAVGIVAYF